jgi:hypothetical protein
MEPALFTDEQFSQRTFMPTCFVIQPFDGSKFDKRFEDVYTPAIKAAGLEPYRVDRDPGVEVPIEAIEEGIRSAALCLADITTDNPNVWYELGFAFASGRPVVMVCGDERIGKKYPFDIQHRTVIPYKAESPRDFTLLQSEITNRLTALLNRSDALRAMHDTEQIAPVQGMSQPELVVLATVAGSIVLPDEGVSAYVAKHDMERAGFTAVGFSLGLKRLMAKRLVVLRDAADQNGETFQVICITSNGWDWIEANEDKFILRKPMKESHPEGEDVPF